MACPCAYICCRYMSCIYNKKSIILQRTCGRTIFFLPHRKAMLLKIDTLLVRRFTILFMCFPIMYSEKKKPQLANICPRIRATTITHQLRPKKKNHRNLKQKIVGIYKKEAFIKPQMTFYDIVRPLWSVWK